MAIEINILLEIFFRILKSESLLNHFVTRAVDKGDGLKEEF